MTEYKRSAGDLFPYFVVREASFTLNSADSQEVAKQDPSRIAIIFSASINATGYRVSPKSDATKDDGIWIADGSGPFRLSHVEYGALVGQSWKAATPAGACVLTVVEVLMSPVPCEEPCK